MNCVAVSAPGSLMLFGEHAVLRGHPAVVCAINRRIRVTLEPNTTREVIISSGLGAYQSPVADLADHPSFRFVLGALRNHRDFLADGLTVKIDSDIDPVLGFGSSAAVTVAMVHGLAWLTGTTLSPDDGMRVAQALIRSVQGRGSGADCAASTLGGVVGMSADPLTAERLTPDGPPLTAVYSGSKTPTAEVVARVDEAAAGEPDLFAALFAMSGAVTGAATHAIRVGDWARVGRLMTMANGLHHALGVDTPELAEIVFWLRSDPGLLGAKISGSGLGDCAVGLGTMHQPVTDRHMTELAIDAEGVRDES